MLSRSAGRGSVVAWRGTLVASAFSMRECTAAKRKGYIVCPSLNFTA